MLEWWWRISSVSRAPLLRKFYERRGNFVWLLPWTYRHESKRELPYIHIPYLPSSCLYPQREQSIRNKMLHLRFEAPFTFFQVSTILPHFLYLARIAESTSSVTQAFLWTKYNYSVLSVYLLELWNNIIYLWYPEL